MAAIQGPDPSPVRPHYQLPAGACDAHCHIYGPASKFPYVPGTAYLPPDAPFEQLQTLHNFLGFERAIIVHPSPHGTDNRVTLDGIARSNGAYRGVAVVDDDITDGELEGLHQGGIRAIRFNFVAHLGGAPELPIFERLCARVKPLGWHVVLHFDAKDLPGYADLIGRMPVPFVIDHMGRVQAEGGLDQQPFKTLLELMRNPLAWVKVTGPERVSTAGPPFHDAIPFARALIEAAPDRVLWGTDWPHPNVKWMPNDGALVNLFELFTDDEGLRHKVLVDNPTRLYWPEQL
ncbi:MAG: 2-pyrone-4,6-dicarboxylate hydrolase [Chloroflexi bacterium]|nr:2-pyrone-4,6-dicarboxylate hydrolase [Chloroflexota bacterium]